LESALEAAQADSARASEQIAALNREIQQLRTELARITSVLADAEAEIAAQDVQITDLSGRLNMALIDKVEEMASYRSEFFGRLRGGIGDRNEMRIVGDRCVLQSEVLFESGSAELEPEGRERLARIADTLLEIAETIPDDIDWILRVDGHTDMVPINTRDFPSNWELSAARAISVVEFLISQGIPPHRL